MEAKKKEAVEWIVLIVVTLIIALILRSFVFVLARVKSISMQPTLVEGQWLFVNKISMIFGEPNYGDIIIFDAPTEKDYVKRLIGKSGDTIEIKDSVVYRNGVALEEEYLPEGLVYDDFALTEVPEGQYFFMGDNRPYSQDSRSDIIGCIDVDKVSGRVVYILYPFKDFGRP